MTVNLARRLAAATMVLAVVGGLTVQAAVTVAAEPVRARSASAWPPTHNRSTRWRSAMGFPRTS